MSIKLNFHHPLQECCNATKSKHVNLTNGTTKCFRLGGNFVRSGSIYFYAIYRVRGKLIRCAEQWVTLLSGSERRIGEQVRETRKKLRWRRGRAAHIYHAKKGTRLAGRARIRIFLGIFRFFFENSSKNRSEPGSTAYARISKASLVFRRQKTDVTKFREKLPKCGKRLRFHHRFDTYEMYKNLKNFV